MVGWNEIEGDYNNGNSNMNEKKKKYDIFIWLELWINHYWNKDYNIWFSTKYNQIYGILINLPLIFR